MPTRLVLTALEDLPLIQPGDDLAGFILAAVKAADLRLENGDVIAVAQKVISKAEGRLVNLSDVAPSPEALEMGEQSGKDPRLVQLILS
ncbi:MAG: coenzyme F420-0:L-glutamate ligase, partial [Chloroflexi bacterium]|nr:coenzyme F420-0:L-glutamate ligase [Chloroflexota bacterium]